ncbi:MAG: hypothetical protein ETSY2_27805 [Candidatus Entotheonella gemina]|uniref:FAD-binding domain-containing protein n=1 Tax=Candidatus Entotheonella gemina TaxID=1429439 RepID=W4M2N8_9BACT|nr:MAG: hypothetical protein ETSY2_27805 [Candidatus Entotheonella gemina]
MDLGKILIAGAGLGGLTAAGCLMKAGYDVEMYEQASELGEIGAGIQISANAMHVMRHLGVEDDLDAVAVRPVSYEFRMWNTAELIQAFPLSQQHEDKHGAPYYHVHRADLHEVLARRVMAMKPNLIALNKKAIGFSEDAGGVTLQFEDGTSARGDLLIGADGIKSAIRAQMLGETRAVYTGDVAWRVTLPQAQVADYFNNLNQIVWMGPSRHAVTYFLRQGTLVNFVGIVESEEQPEESWTIRRPWEELKADFEGWHESIQALIDRADKDACFLWSLHIREPISEWSTDKVTLLGDAAHPTLPYLAQGAAMAMEDGAVLTRALDPENDLAQALDLYQRNRVERTSRVVRESSANGILYHATDPATIREAFSRRNMGKERDQWLFPYNPLTVALT